ncbi:phosphoribosylformylglycinamidine synthase I [Herpetosiphon sp. NSE202]|uniref:phosphoribosylformylglycinamidine synthase I n=1 Tax=Herpetosiphon sp. NSE202 TaxID=3351349 RepID=UPI0036455D34
MTKVLVLRAPGINCDAEAAEALELAGATAERVHVNRLAEGSVQLADYGMLLIPGGFAYGDHLGAGRMLAVDLIYRLREDLSRFVADGRPVLGICNGFQVLVKTGLLPSDTVGQATLIDNASGNYECRWIKLGLNSASPCIFTQGLSGTLDLPVGHGEGRFLTDQATFEKLQANNQIVVQYLDQAGQPTMDYPANPNGALHGIAGICNPAGNVFGLMPHPDRAFLPQHHPQWRRRGLDKEGPGMAIFRNGVRAMALV